jgi:hypothetical protein
MEGAALDWKVLLLPRPQNVRRINESPASRIGSESLLDDLGVATSGTKIGGFASRPMKLALLRFQRL